MLSFIPICLSLADSQIKQQLSSLQYVKNLCEARLQLLKCGQNDSDIPVLSSSVSASIKRHLDYNRIDDVSASINRLSD